MLALCVCSVFVCASIVIPLTIQFTCAGMRRLPDPNARTNIASICVYIYYTYHGCARACPA